ncbi:MAG: peptidoglycan editing factor PgeF [Bryobacteraceae bacterium]|nr:peptidoglycan editing factor PgeF [Bryobacteraceae bacterium]
MFERGNDGVFRSSLLRSQSWLEHGFGSRNAGTWPGEYSRVRQVHSALVVASGEVSFLPEAPQADGIVTAKPGEWVGIRTADCVSILIADPMTRCIGAFHAGWRGTVGNIASAGVAEMARLCGTRPQDLVAAIGPAIGLCCFEVGPEVAAEFALLFPETADVPAHLDLPEANRRQLLAAGLRNEAIDVFGACTKCGPLEFESWRRDREASGRMVSAIRIRPQ